MAKILLYAHDPGGANAVKPLIAPLISKGEELFVYGDGPALNILPNVVKYDADTDELINNIKPDFIITGTSTSCLTEKKLRKSAHKNKIQSMAILDHWVNYNRFTPYSCAELRENKKYDELEFLPDYYVVMDEFAKQETIKEHIPAKIIYPLGNPHFEAIKNEFDKIDSSNLRKELIGDKNRLVVWGSEPYIEDYGHGMELESLKDLVDIIHEDWQLVIKPHPRENEDKFKEFKNIKIARNVNSREIIKAADLVMSMTSMFLIEAIIAGKPALSYQKNEKDKNKFILTKMNALPFINDKIELEKRLKKPFEKPKFEVKFDAKDKITEFIEEKLCQS